MLRKLVFTPAILLVFLCAYGQEQQPAPSLQLPAGYLDQVNANIDRMDKQLTGKTGKYLREMALEEHRLKKKLGKIDSAAAGSIFGNISERYGRLQQKMVEGKNGLLENPVGAYIPAFDSLKNTLLFLQKNPDILKNVHGFSPGQLQSVAAKVQALQGKLNAAEGLKDYFQQRKQLLSNQLGKFGMTGQLSGLNKKAYYYKQQLTDWKGTLKDPSRLQQKAVQVLSQVPAYGKFIRQHSYLSSLFGAPEEYHLSDSSMKDLQTRASVQKMIQDKVGVGGPGAEQQVMQQVQQSGVELNEIKNKLLQLGSREDLADPGFKPNTQKTKSLWKRLEYGADLQFDPSRGLLPTLCDLALSVGYKLSDNGTIGVGAAYKAGLGDGLQHIHFSSQGVGLRSYVDWRLKKNLYLSGGYERNYLHQFQSIAQLQAASGWQQSGLIGLSRKYRLSSKVNGKLQLLFDFLSYNQTPRAQPIVFRTGWSF